METILMDWTRALEFLREQKATGKGTTSSFKGRLQGGEYVQLADSAGCYVYEGKTQSAGAIAAQELKRIGAKRRPASSDNENYAKPPRYAVPGYYGRCAYIDIKSAYYNIYRRIQWDITFLPSKKRVKDGEVELSEIELETKRAKVAIVGMALSKRGFIWENGQTSTYKRLSGFYNPQVVWYIWGVLSAIARRARSAGAVYWNTDGAIARIEDIPAIARVIKASGLDFSIKAYGRCVVWGVGSYTIGDIGKPRKLDTPSFYLSDTMSSEIAYNHFLSSTKVLLN